MCQISVINLILSMFPHSNDYSVGDYCGRGRRVGLYQPVPQEQGVGIESSPCVVLYNIPIGECLSYIYHLLYCTVCIHCIVYRTGQAYPTFHQHNSNSSDYVEKGNFVRIIFG